MSSEVKIQHNKLDKYFLNGGTVVFRLWEKSVLWSDCLRTITLHSCYQYVTPLESNKALDGAYY